MIKVEFGARAYYVEHGDGGRNYDTHAGQLPHHERISRNFQAALGAFHADLDASGLANRAAVLVSASSGGGLPRMSVTGQIMAPHRRCSYSAAAFAGVRPVRLPA